MSFALNLNSLQFACALARQPRIDASFESLNTLVFALPLTKPWNQGLFYRDFSYSTGLVKLGKLDSDVDALRNAQTTKATIELIKE